MAPSPSPSFIALLQEQLRRREDFSCLLADELAFCYPLASDIRPVVDMHKVCGRTVTVRTMGYDLSAVYEGISASEPGDIVVTDTRGNQQLAFWGETTTITALERGIAAVVIDGCFRDVEAIRRLGFPVFARGTVPNPAPRTQKGVINCSIQCGGAPVRPGDTLLGDDNGIVIIPQGTEQHFLTRFGD